jgi:hypothetical protein
VAREIIVAQSGALDPRVIEAFGWIGDNVRRWKGVTGSSLWGL